jgi:hypothetical protein
MLDLYNNKYNRAQLKEYIFAVAMIDILKTQVLDCSFCVRYILNENYHFLSEDDNISIDDVVKYQPHISKTQLLLGLANYTRADDSVEDFESFALRHP